MTGAYVTNSPEETEELGRRLGETAETRTAYEVSALSSHVLEYFSLAGPAE